MPKLLRPFEAAMEFVLKWEGGFVNDPVDPGGATNYGITLNTARENGMDINGDGKVDVDDIRAMTPEAAYAVYKNKYWSPLFNVVDNLSWDVAITAFDAAVNCGPGRACKWLERARNMEDPAKYINNLRRVHYNTIISLNPKLSKFKRGWDNRVNDLEKYVDILREEVTQGLIAPLPS